MNTKTRSGEARMNQLNRNEAAARTLRQRFRDAGVYVITVVSSPGAGKTFLVDRTMTQLRPRFRAAALGGHDETEHRAAHPRRSTSGIEQIPTGTAGHLDASTLERALEGRELRGLDYLFIENVGNLVCPASNDLGEDLRLVLMPVTEREDKPLKDPVIFRGADVAVITKADLAPTVKFDWVAAKENMQRVRPGMHTVSVSAMKGDGMRDWLRFLTGLTRVEAAACGGLSID